jgi:hypothetical protein
MLPVLFALALVAILLIVSIAGQPDEFKVVRTASIAAPPDKVFPHVNNLHKWEDWSPWAKLDPNAKNTFAGPDAAVGAAMSWSGNNKVGEGKMTITESAPSSLIQLRLEFLRPFKATNSVEFTLAPRGPQTFVTWTMFGKNNFPGKIFGLFVNCEQMCGKDFEKGLASLKAIAETTKSQP